MSEEIKISHNDGTGAYYVLTVDDTQEIVDACQNLKLAGFGGMMLVDRLLERCRGKISKVENYGYYDEVSHHVRLGGMRMDPERSGWRLHDGYGGQPAVRQFDGNGTLVLSMSYGHGSLNLLEEFNDKGQLVRRVTGHNGKEHDTTDGEPAIKEFDPSTGKLIGAVSYKDGVFAHLFTPEEIEALNDGTHPIRIAQKNPAPPAKLKPDIRVL